ncbi:unnamed protein product, partial [Ixodes persulcatus]
SSSGNSLIFLSDVPARFRRCCAGLKISPKSCENAIGQYGTCMFVWECIKLDGQHLGTCTDGFLYGSCCQYDDSENSVAGGLSAGSSSASQAPQSPHKPHRPVPVRPAATTSFNSVAASSSSSSSSYPQRNFTLIYLTPTSSSQRPTTVKPTAASVTRPATKPSTTATKPTSTPPTSMATATRWPPTFRPPGITTFWSLFRPRPTLVPIITFRPTRRPPFRPSPTAATSTTTTTTTTAVPTMATQGATRPTVSALHNVYGRPPTTRRPAATPTSSALTAVASHCLFRGMTCMFGLWFAGECGVPTLLPQTKVVGGKSSSFGAWPWQVSVRRTSFFGFSSTHRCGGAILNRYWIATAGHCVDDLLLSQIRIRVGEYDFSSVLEPYPYAERGAKKKVVHPKYNFFTYENDLALVRVDEPLEFLPHIAPICLPPDNESDDLIGRNATVTGWGRLSEGGVLPSVLQEVKVPIVSNEKCKNMFLAAGRHEYIPNIFMCAGFEEGGRDSCQGDSGGPLQIQSKDGRWFLAGIISWGIGCAEPNLPGVCTRISRFKDWIIKSTA